MCVCVLSVCVCGGGGGGVVGGGGGGHCAEHLCERKRGGEKEQRCVCMCVCAVFVFVLSVCVLSVCFVCVCVCLFWDSVEINQSITQQNQSTILQKTYSINQQFKKKSITTKQVFWK